MMTDCHDQVEGYNNVNMPMVVCVCVHPRTIHKKTRQGSCKHQLEDDENITFCRQLQLFSSPPMTLDDLANHVNGLLAGKPLNKHMLDMYRHVVSICFCDFQTFPAISTSGLVWVLGWRILCLQIWASSVPEFTEKLWVTGTATLTVD